jgi:hypothetical protein
MLRGQLRASDRVDALAQWRQTAVELAAEVAGADMADSHVDATAAVVRPSDDADR